MIGYTPPHLDGLLAAAKTGDAEAMFELGAFWIRVTAEAQDQARLWLRGSAQGGSLEGRLALAAQHVADGEHREAQWQLQVIETHHADADPVYLVGVAPNVLGPHLHLDGDGETETDLFAVFTVITTHPQRAAAVLDELRDTLLEIDERGVLMSYAERVEAEIAESFLTPRYVAGIESSWLGARVLLDTRGGMWSAMGRTIIELIAGALADAHIPAVIGGRCAELDAQFVAWRDSAIGC
jgi:hypothetical protein